MAVKMMGYYPEEKVERMEERYIGCVLDTYEHNGSWDSDFYAICWDEEKGEVIEVEYYTTRFAGYGEATVDVTLENLRKAYRFYFNKCRKKFDDWTKFRIAKSIKKGTEALVVRGIKIPKGTIGKVFWVGERYNPYSRRTEERVGLEVDGERVFLPRNYVVANEWEKRIPAGKERKRLIRENALGSLPARYRKGLESGEWFKKEAA